MKILLISPACEKGGLSSIVLFNWPPYSLLQIASLTPKEHEVKIINERDGPINFDEHADLVGLTTTTASATRAYEIAQEFKKRGVKTIIGGIHVSALPEEAQRFADCVVIGEADEIWSVILDDFQRGKLKAIYKAEQPPKNLNFPLCRNNIRKTIPVSVLCSIFKIDVNFAFLQTQRGCPNDCEFCAVSNFNGKNARKKSVSYLLSELEQERRQNRIDYLFFIDDNILTDKAYARELFKELRCFNLKWVSQTDIKIADDDIIDLAHESGLTSVFLGLESIDEKTLIKSICKTKNLWRPQYERAIKKLRDRGISVEGGFIFGFDEEKVSIVKQTTEWALDNKLDFAQFAILTPLPGTRFFKKLEQEKRITTKDWSLYNLLHCVYEPRGEWTKEILEKEIKQAYQTSIKTLCETCIIYEWLLILFLYHLW